MLFEADRMILRVRVHPDGRQIALDTRGYKFETMVAERLFAAAKK